MAKSKSHSDQLVYALAETIRDPSSGNIEFIFPSPDGAVDENTPRLYAFSRILSEPALENFRLLPLFFPAR